MANKLIFYWNENILNFSNEIQDLIIADINYYLLTGAGSIYFINLKQSELYSFFTFMNFVEPFIKLTLIQEIPNNC